MSSFFSFFFFQAEDGIRDTSVTGVQTCALPISLAGAQGIHINEIYFVATDARLKDASMAAQIAAASLGGDQEEFRQRSEERRVGKESRTRWWPEDERMR